MASNRRVAVTAISILWLSAITFFYFFTLHSSSPYLALRPSHRYYFEAIVNSVRVHPQGRLSPNPIYPIMLGIFVPYIILFVVARYRYGKEKLTLNWRPIYYLILGLYVTMVVAFSWYSYYNFFVFVWPVSLKKILEFYPVLIGELALLSLLCLGLGKKIVDRFDLFLTGKGSLLRSLIVSFAFGSSCLSFLLFFIALVGKFNPAVLWSLVGLIAVVCYKEVFFWLKEAVNQKGSYEIKLLDSRVALTLLIIVLIAQNFITLVRPFPIGHDDLISYANLPSLISNSGHLINGYPSHPWEMILALGFRIFHEPAAVFLTSLIVGIFIVLALYYLTKDYLMSRGESTVKAELYSLLMVAIFYSLPLVVHQSSGDLKTNLPAFFLATVSLILFFDWQRQTKAGNKYLYASALMAGAAFATNNTLLIWAVALLTMTVYTLFLRRSQLITSLLLLVFCVVFFLSPFLPYGVRNLSLNKSLQLSSFEYSPNDSSIYRDVSAELNSASNGKVIQSTKIQEDYGQYFGYKNNLQAYFKLPLSVTLATSASTPYIDVGFVFLALVPLLLLLLIFQGVKGKGEQLITMVFLSAAVFWIIWDILANGVIWYGLAGFILLILLATELLFRLDKLGWAGLKNLCISILTIWLIACLFLRLSYLPEEKLITEPLSLEYGLRKIDASTYLAEKFDLYMPTINKINSEIEANGDSPPRIYMQSSTFIYLMDKNHETVYLDELMDTFHVLNDNGPSKTLDRLKNLDFQYIFFDHRSADSDKTPDHSYYKKYQELQSFIASNQEHIKTLVPFGPLTNISIVKIN